MYHFRVDILYALVWHLKLGIIRNLIFALINIKSNFQHLTFYKIKQT